MLKLTGERVRWQIILLRRNATWNKKNSDKLSGPRNKKQTSVTELRKLKRKQYQNVLKQKAGIRSCKSMYAVIIPSCKLICQILTYGDADREQSIKFQRLNVYSQTLQIRLTRVKMNIQYLHGIHATANSSLENCLYYRTDARRIESFETFYKEKYTHP